MAKNVESASEEMQRLIRSIAGSRDAGEREPLLMARAARKMGISLRRARSYWYAQPCIISSEDMDRARRLASIQPVERLIDAAEEFDRYIEDVGNDCLGLVELIIADLLGYLRDRRRGAGRDPGAVDPQVCDIHLDRPAQGVAPRNVVRVRPPHPSSAIGARVTSSRSRVGA